MRFPLKIILILLYIAKDIDLYAERLMYFGFSFSGIIYIIFFILILASIFAVAHIKNNYVRIGLGVLFFLCAVAYDSYQRIMLEYLDYNAYINMIDAAGSMGEAFQQYMVSYLISAGLALLLFIGIALKPKKRIIRKRYSISLTILAFLLFTFLVFYKGGSGAQGLPPVYTPLSYSSLTLYELSQDKFGLREEVTIKRENTEIGHDIIYIIDESVSANYLDINDVNGAKSSLNQEYTNANIHNFGYAASIAKCSASSNITLRYGGTRKDYMKIIYTKPSLWNYAQKAGLKTVYIDAQRTEGELQNGMTDRELTHVDEFIQYNDVSIQQRDQEASKTLVKLINNNTSEFIMVNKMGIHFPIHDKYPDEFMTYKPVLPRGNWIDISDTGLRTGFNGTPEEWKEYRNSYRNTIEWNVGEFFSNIFENANLDNSTIVYTSDHGQDLHERGNPGVNTHCSSNPNMEEGLVPLVIIEGKNLKTLDWESKMNLNKNKSSHYNIFPTLLKLMHYDVNEIKNVYGNTLDLETKDEYTFNTYWNSRLGRKPTWMKIDLNKIVKPSPSDYTTKE